jgi:hypothetical protein
MWLAGAALSQPFASAIARVVDLSTPSLHHIGHRITHIRIIKHTTWAYDTDLFLNNV